MADDKPGLDRMPEVIGFVVELLLILVTLVLLGLSPL